MRLTKKQLKDITGRDEYDFDWNWLIEPMKYKSVVVTGAAGAVGSAVIDKIKQSPYGQDIWVVGTDIISSKYTDMELDVNDPVACKRIIDQVQPSFVFHFAADKHAPVGEERPISTYNTDINGAVNMLTAARELLHHDVKFVLASTCKACNPETVYGASKLIAERVTLNNFGNVARFYNIADSSENVFEIWGNTPEDQPIHVANCDRYFMTMDEAVALSLYSVRGVGKRYCLDWANKRNMFSMARKICPDREVIDIPPRRGDRVIELLCGTSENIWQIEDSKVKGMIAEVRNYHDYTQSS